MSNHHVTATPMSRVTCNVHHHIAGRIIERLRALGIRSVVTENARSVRRRRYRSRLAPSRRIVKTQDSPVNLFRFDVLRNRADQVLQAVIEAADMDVPGRGTIFSQEVEEYGTPAALDVAPEESLPQREPSLLSDLALITCILSASGSGERLAELALELGTGVPIVTLGTGTGMRDRLGLLRITVSPEKELVHLLVPAIDAEGVVRQLVEEGRLNGPGRGFVYCTLVQKGVLDTRLQIGPQDHAASMEQVVAAIDKLYTGTEWRRRFSTEETAAGYRLLRQLNEIALVCAEERSARFVDAAPQAGASGATSARVRRVRLEDSASGDAARERCIMTVPSSMSEPIVAAILACRADTPEWLDSLQVLPARFAFTYPGERQAR